MAAQASLIFAMLAMVCWAFGDFFIQRSARKIGDLETLTYIGIIGVLGLLPFVIKDFYLLNDFRNIMLLLILGVVTFIAALVNFEALKKGKLSVIDVIFELELPVTIALGFVFFRESLTFSQAMAILAVFLGIIMISTKSFSHWKGMLEKGVLIALVGAAMMGVLNFLTASSSKLISPWMAVWFPAVVFTIISLVFICRREGLGRFIGNGVRFRKVVLAMGVFDTLAWLFYAMAVFDGEISLITAITESYPALSMFLGMKFNRESVRSHQYLGAFLALASSVVLCFFA